MKTNLYLHRTCIYTQKIKFIPHIIHMIFDFKELCNLINIEHGSQHTHLKMEIFYSFDEGFYPCKKPKQSINFFMRYCLSKNSEI